MRLFWIMCCCGWLLNLPSNVGGQTSGEAPQSSNFNAKIGQRELLINVYYRGGNAADEAWLQRARDYAAQQPGLQVVPRNVATDADMQKSLQTIQTALKLPNTAVPLVYGLNRAVHQAKDAADFNSQMDRLRLLEMYCQPNCPHCDQAEQHLKKTLPQYPGITFVKRNIVTDSSAKSDLQEHLRRRNVNTQTVPVLHMANQLLIGFDSQQKTGEKVDELLKRWSLESPTPSR
jgi:glutaredoxin